jgi:hypothetical protein
LAFGIFLKQFNLPWERKMKSKRSHKPARKSLRKPAARLHRTHSSTKKGLLVDVARTIGSALGTVSAQVSAASGNVNDAVRSARKSKPVAQMRVTAKKVEREVERQARSVRQRVEKLIPA